MHSPELLTALDWFRAVHSEKQPHKYAASLTTERSCVKYCARLKSDWSPAGSDGVRQKGLGFNL
jgi:hypothetical protein